VRAISRSHCCCHSTRRAAASARHKTQRARGGCRRSPQRSSLVEMDFYSWDQGVHGSKERVDVDAAARKRIDLSMDMLGDAPHFGADRAHSDQPVPFVSILGTTSRSRLTQRALPAYTFSGATRGSNYSSMDSFASDRTSRSLARGCAAAELIRRCHIK